MPKKAPLIHVAQMVFNEPLAIIPEKLEAILRAVGPRLVVGEDALPDLRNLHVLTVPSGVVSWTNGSNLNPGSVVVGSGTSAVPLPVSTGGVTIKAQADDEEDDSEKLYRITPEGVALIPIRGTLLKRWSWISAYSGNASYMGLRQAATAAIADPMVKAVLFDVDSPGGTTHGCFELSEALYQMRGEKPIWAIANDLAASAAYALASAADRLFVTRTGGVGSIGVFALHADQSGADEQAGLKYTYVYAGKKKVDGNPHEPLSRSARSDIQEEVDREYEMFVSAVARNRGFARATPAKIRNTEAQVQYGDNAIGLLADEVATYEETLEKLTAKVSGKSLVAAPAVKTIAADADTGVQPTAGPALAETAEPGNNAVNPTSPTGGQEVMAKDRTTAAEAEDRKAAAAIAAADDGDDKEPDGDEDDDKEAKSNKECDDEEDEKPSARHTRVAAMPAKANATAVTISNLCTIAGAPELAADYIVKGFTVDKVIEKLSARRAKASAEGGGVNSYVSGDPATSGAQASVDQAIEQARVLSMNSGGTLTQTKALERVLRTNPDIYSSYLEERGAVAAKVAFTGGGKALNDYVLNNQRRYMRNLGLSVVIDDVPARRAM